MKSLELTNRQGIIIINICRRKILVDEDTVVGFDDGDSHTINI